MKQLSTFLLFLSFFTGMQAQISWPDDKKAAIVLTYS